MGIFEDKAREAYRQGKYLTQEECDALESDDMIIVQWSGSSKEHPFTVIDHDSDGHAIVDNEYRDSLVGVGVDLYSVRVRMADMVSLENRHLTDDYKGRIEQAQQSKLVEVKVDVPAPKRIDLDRLIRALDWRERGRRARGRFRPSFSIPRVGQLLEVRVSTPPDGEMTIYLHWYENHTDEDRGQVRVEYQMERTLSQMRPDDWALYYYLLKPIESVFPPEPCAGRQAVEHLRRRRLIFGEWETREE